MCTIFWYIIEVNSAQIDDAKDLDVVMSMYNFLGYSKNYSQMSGC